MIRFGKKTNRKYTLSTTGKRVRVVQERIPYFIWQVDASNRVYLTRNRYGEYGVLTMSEIDDLEKELGIAD